MRIDPNLGIILECGNRAENIKKRVVIAWKQIKYAHEGVRFEATDKAVSGLTSYNEALIVGASRGDDVEVTLERWGVEFDGREWNESTEFHFAL